MVLDLDPALILKSPWLWDAETLAWAQAKIDAAKAADKPTEGS